MDTAIEQIILRERPWCELPDENGRPVCMRAAAKIITLPAQYSVAVCKECSDYINKERRNKHA